MVCLQVLISSESGLQCWILRSRFCRAYLAVLQAYKAEVVLLMGSVPLALTQTLSGYATALEAVCTQAEAQIPTHGLQLLQ